MSKNLAYDSHYLTIEDIVFLHSIKDKDNINYSNAAVRLWGRGLLYEASAHYLKLTTRGRLACKGIFVGSKIQVTNKHHLPAWRGLVGEVTAIHDFKCDADGVDENGYRLLRSRPTFAVDVAFPNKPGTFVFHRLDDLDGYILVNDGYKQNNVAWEYGKVIDSPQSIV